MWLLIAKMTSIPQQGSAWKNLFLLKLHQIKIKVPWISFGTGGWSKRSPFKFLRFRHFVKFYGLFFSFSLNATISNQSQSKFYIKGAINFKKWNRRSSSRDKLWLFLMGLLPFRYKYLLKKTNFVLLAFNFILGICYL